MQYNNAMKLNKVFGFDQLTKVLNFPTTTLEGNFITAKSLINDKSEIINLTDDINKSNSTRQPLQDLNIVQEKPKQRLEELISKLTADKYNLHNTHTGSLGRTGLTQEVLVRNMSNVSFFYRERWTKLQSNYGMAGSRFSRRSELGRNMLSIVVLREQQERTL
uniref:Uncharacterized protein n=1 Tax=Rhizophagus irregularis (strain DAOM 181602 / DAOM 197198 / MUCL 43194) TaxID=747089 RepID=U9TSD2_RHIID